MNISQDELEHILAAIPALLALIAACSYNAPPLDYHNIEDNPNSTKRVKRLVLCSRIISGIQLILSCFSCAFSQISVFIVAFWLVILMRSKAFNSLQSIRNGSHFMLFLVLCPVIIVTAYKGLFFRCSLTLTIIIVAQLLISTLYCLIVGFWSDRNEEDNINCISREKGASVIATLSFNWLSPLIDLGNEKVMQDEDIWKLVESDTTQELNTKFDELQNQNGYSLMWNLVLLVRPFIVYQWTCALFSSILAFAPPYYLFQVITFIKTATPETRYLAIWYLVLLFLASSVKAIIDGQVFFI
jgi:hypothetical protein